MPWCKISGRDCTQEAVWDPQWNGGPWSNEGPLVITASCDSPRSVTSPAFVDCPRTFIASLLCLELALHYALTFSVILLYVTFSAPKTPCPSSPHQALRQTLTSAYFLHNFPWSLVTQPFATTWFTFQQHLQLWLVSATLHIAQQQPQSLPLLAPSGALIAIPTY